MHEMTVIEACHKARLLFLPVLGLVDWVEDDCVCVVVRIDEVGEGWLRVSQRPARRDERVRRGALDAGTARVLSRTPGEWELLHMLGVQRTADGLELWPQTAREPAELRARIVVPKEHALAQGLRIDWEAR
jgi:hypothetical protein